MRIDEYEMHPKFPGALSADLAQFYHGISLDDVWAGRVRAGYVLGLIEQLHLNPYSRVRMISMFDGDIRAIGWDANAELSADRYDQITQIVSSFGKNKSTLPRYPRPGKPVGEAPASDLFAESVDDFDIDKFMSVIAGR